MQTNVILELDIKRTKNNFVTVIHMSLVSLKAQTEVLLLKQQDRRWPVQISLDKLVLNIPYISTKLLIKNIGLLCHYHFGQWIPRPLGGFSLNEHI